MHFFEVIQFVGVQLFVVFSYNFYFGGIGC